MSYFDIPLFFIKIVLFLVLLQNGSATAGK